MVKAWLVDLERGRQREDRISVLDGHHPPRRECAAVADAVHLKDDRHRRIAGAHEIAVQRVHMPRRVHRPLRRNQRLRDHLTAKHPLPAHLWAATTEQIVFQGLKVENGRSVLAWRWT